MILYGASGHGKVALDCLQRSRVEVSGFFDDDERITDFCGFPVWRYDESLHPGQKIIISIGDNTLRKRIAEKSAHKFGIVLDPSSIRAAELHIGEGSVVFQNVVLQAGTSVGSHAIINTSASVDHDCVIGNYVHVSPNSTLCGNVSVGEGTQIGAAAVVLPGIKIGNWSVIGAGAVVREDIPDNVVVAGNPGRIIKKIL